MKKKAFKRKRNILNVLAVLVMLMAMLLTACSSGKTDAAPASEETSAAEADKEAEQVKEEAAEPEPTAEPTPEPTPEAVVYEGIDMESTLPGEEWIKTFDGIIDEPKLVVFNDDTNKKVIVENGQEVEFSRTDKLYIYVPNQKDAWITEQDVENFQLIEGRTYSKLSEQYKVGDKVVTKNIIQIDGNISHFMNIFWLNIYLIILLRCYAKTIA